MERAVRPMRRRGKRDRQILLEIGLRLSDREAVLDRARSWDRIRRLFETGTRLLVSRELFQPIQRDILTVSKCVAGYVCQIDLQNDSRRNRCAEETDR